MYFAVLDLLRFFSAATVMGYHLFSFPYGRLGVYLFFIISGFVIHFSLKKGLKDYVVSRFLRLFPLFWVCCTITYLVTVYYGVNLPLKNYLISMFLVNDGKIASMVDGSYWTLTFELLFYFYIGIFVWIFSTERLMWFYTLWLTVAFLSFLFNLEHTIIAKLLAVRLTAFFVFGGVMALLVEKWSTSVLLVRLLYIGTLLGSSLMPIIVSQKILGGPEAITNTTGVFTPLELPILESCFVIIPVAAYLSLCHFSQGRIFKQVALVLGGITYPFYLLHSKIAETVIKGQGFHYGKVHIFSITMAVALLAISYTLSVYDLQIRKILKKWIGYKIFLG